MAEIKLPSGRTLDPNNGYIGISDDLRVAEGFDGDLRGASLDEMAQYSEAEPWSTEDRLALAEIMIERWRRYKESVGLGKAMERGHRAPFPMVRLLIECQMTNPPRPRNGGVFDGKNMLGVFSLEDLRRCAADLDEMEARLKPTPSSVLEKHRRDT